LRVKCPVCGVEGTLITRVINGKIYYYVRHRSSGKVYEHGITLLKDQALTVIRNNFIESGRSIIRYEGSDTRIVPFLLQLIPPHHTYVEVFGGGAALLLHKSPSPIEVYNDIDSELVNLFMCVASKECVEKLIEICNQLPFSRVLAHECGKIDLKVLPPSPDPYYACVTMYRYRNQYLGRGRGGFAVSVCRESSRYWFSAIRRLRKIHRRLRYVVFECKDFRELIKVYDRVYTFFYCDPPHHNNPALHGYYGCENWSEKDFLDLLSILKSINGKFLLKYTWSEDVEKTISDYGFNYVVVSYIAHGVPINPTRSGESRREIRKYIFAMNYVPSRVEPKGSVKRIEKIVILRS